MGYDSVCPECQVPLVLKLSKHGGRQEDGRTLRARSVTRKVFDLLWRQGVMTRGNAHRWMQDTLNITPAEALISHLDLEDCKRLVRAIQKEFPHVLAQARGIP